MDFVSEQLLDGRRIRILSVLDTCTRECLRLEIGHSLTSAHVSRVLEELELVHGRPSRILSDNGPEFTTFHLHAWTEDRKITHEFIEPGKPLQNGFVESFHCTLRDECLNEALFADLQEAEDVTESWRLFYNQERPHSSLRYSTPSEYATALRDLSLAANEQIEKKADPERPACSLAPDTALGVLISRALSSGPVPLPDNSCTQTSNPK